MVRFIVQDEIRKGITLPEDFEILTFSANDKNFDWKGWFKSLEQDYKPTVSFVSIPVARYIQKFLPKLKSSLLLPVSSSIDDMNSIYNWHSWHTAIPIEFQLNDSGVITTVRDILINNVCFEYQDVFCKPISGWKSFTGFFCSAKDLSTEINSLIQIEKIGLNELVLLSVTKEISEIEWRCFLIDGELVTAAPYSWDEIDLEIDLPNPVKDLALRSALYLQEYNDCFVIDIALFGGKPKVIEINCVSTSGWYEGMDVTALFQSISNLYA